MTARRAAAAVLAVLLGAAAVIAVRRVMLALREIGELLDEMAAGPGKDGPT